MVFVGTISGSVYAISGDGAAITAGPSDAGSVGPHRARLRVPLPVLGHTAVLTGSPCPPTSVTDVRADLPDRHRPRTGTSGRRRPTADAIAISARTGGFSRSGASRATVRPVRLHRDNGDGYGRSRSRRRLVLRPRRRALEVSSTTRSDGSSGPGQVRSGVGRVHGSDRDRGGAGWTSGARRRQARGRATTPPPARSSARSTPSGNARQPWRQLARDRRNGTIYVSGAGPNQVFVFDPTGAPLRIVARGSSRSSNGHGDRRRGAPLVTRGRTGRPTRDPGLLGRLAA